MRGVLPLACLLLVVAGCGVESPANPKRLFCSPSSTQVPCTAARVGVEYPLSLVTHCGVGSMYFDGRYWVIEPTQPAHANSVDGFMTLVARSLAQFRGEGLQFAFKPAPKAFLPPACY